MSGENKQELKPCPTKDDMKEIPILFNGDMVRAILGGDKTQTRRPMKDKICGSVVFEGGKFKDIFRGAGGLWDCKYPKSPFGKAGDILWVRENLSVVDMPDMGDVPCWLYSADEYRHYSEAYEKACKNNSIRSDLDGIEIRPCDWGFGTKPSIHMPKWACRTKLRVKRVWVEQVQDIDDRQGGKEGMMYYSGMKKYCDSCRMMFQHCWDSIYGTWSDNPWVWCCEFEVIKGEDK
jgi:hypothetical protein